MKKLLAGTLAMLIAVSAAVIPPASEKWSGFNAEAEEVSIDEIPNLGGCGTFAGWSMYDGNKTLSVSGIGDMYEHRNNLDLPEKTILSNVSKLVIEEGITTISWGAFRDLPNLEEVEIADSVELMYSNSFSIPLDEKNLKGGVELVYNEDKAYGVYYVDGWAVNIKDNTNKAAGEEYTIELREGTRGIASNAFADLNAKTKLNGVNIPGSVKYVSSDAFNSKLLVCADVTDDGLYIIDDWVVGAADSVSDTVDCSGYKGVANGAFSGKTKVTELILPDNTTAVSTYNTHSTFYNCKSLESIDLTKLLHIGYKAFFGTNLKKVEIPDGFEYIGERAFYESPGITDIIIPDSVKYIDKLAISNSAGTSKVTVTLSDMKRYITAPTFSYINAKLNILYKEGIIHDSQFYGLKMTSVVLNDGITTIEDKAFANNDTLKEITIPKSVAEIGDNVFTLYKNNGDFNKTAPSSLVIYCYEGSYAQTYAEKNNIKYELIDESLPTDETEPTDTTEEPAVTYETEPAVTTEPEVTETTVTSVTDAPETTTAQTTVTDSEEDEKFDKYGLIYEKHDRDNDGVYDAVSVKKCDKSLSQAEVPAEVDGLPVDSIGMGAFYECANLEKVTLNEGIKYIDVIAFIDCTKLTEISLPESLKEISLGAFQNTGLTSIVIPKNVTIIGSSVFEDCTSLESIDFPESVEEIHNRAFYNTPWLEKKQKENPMVIVNDIVIDGAKCSGKIIIPDNIKRISAEAFFGNCEITDVVIPKNVMNLGFGAFYCCENLKNVIIENPECEFSKSKLEDGTEEFDITISDGLFGNAANFNGTIYGHYNSTAHEYAKFYNFNFESIENAPAFTTATAAATEPAVTTETTVITASDVTETEETTKIPVTTETSEATKVPETTEATKTTVSTASTETETSSTTAKITMSAGIITTTVNLPKYGDYLYYAVRDVGINGPTDTFVEIAGCEYDAVDVEIPAEIDGIPVLMIGSAAFMDHVNLKSVKIPDSLETIFMYSFSGCKNLETINMPESLNAVWDRSFVNCESIKSITIPRSVEKIGKYAFNVCSSLKEITILNPDCDIRMDAYTIQNGVNSDHKPYFNGTIYGYKNSTAQKYAETFGSKFVAIKSEIEGDISGNGKVDLYDAIEVAKFMVGKRKFTEEERKMADFNGDSKVDLYDAIAIAEYMIKK